MARPRWREPPPLIPTAAVATLITIAAACDWATPIVGWHGYVGRTMICVSVVGLWALVAYAIAERRRSGR
jgi:hypothetical protein